MTPFFFFFICFQLAASEFRPEAPLYPRTHRGYVDPTERCLMLSSHGIATPKEDFVWSLAVTLGNLRLALRRPRDVQGPGGTPTPDPQATPTPGRPAAPREAQGLDSPTSPSPGPRGTPSPDPSMSGCQSRSEGSSPPRGALYPSRLQMTLRSGRRLGSPGTCVTPTRNRNGSSEE